MKGILLFFAMLTIGFAAQADVVVHVGLDLGIGRAKKNCKGTWICIRVTDVSVPVVQKGMITAGHGIVRHDDGSISIAIDMALLRKQDQAKYEELLSATSITLDSPDSLPEEFTRPLGYTGKNTFAAGEYSIERPNAKYVLIRLH